jgi:hypothetical protein
LNAADLASVSLAEWVSDDAIANLKFSDCLPRPLAIREVESRLRDDTTVRLVMEGPINSFRRQSS